MLTREIHNTIRMMLGHIASTRGREWEAGEIDSTWNRMASQFIATRAANYLKGELQSVEDLQSLIVADWISLSEQTTASNYRIKLAANHGGLLNVTLYGDYDCNNTVSLTTLGDTTKYAVELTDTVKANAPFYETVGLELGALIASLTTARTLKYDNLDIYEQLRWLARENGIYVNNRSFYSLGIPFQLKVDGTNMTRVTSTVSRRMMAQTGTLLKSTIIAPTEINARLGAAYFGNYKNHVLLVPVSDYFLAAYTGVGCTLSYAAITYIKKPRPISLILGSETDLPDNGKVHEIICKMTVTELMGGALDDRYVIQLKEQIKAFYNSPA